MMVKKLKQNGDTLHENKFNAESSKSQKSSGMIQCTCPSIGLTCHAYSLFVPVTSLI